MAELEYWRIGGKDHQVRDTSLGKWAAFFRKSLAGPDHTYLMIEIAIDFLIYKSECCPQTPNLWPYWAVDPLLHGGGGEHAVFT